MGFRFFRRMKTAPGVRLNFSKSGISPSVGVRGARVTFGRRGIRKTVGIPGTGLFYTEVSSPGRGRGTARAKPAPLPPPKHDLELGFFKRLFTPKPEQAFVDGCRAYVAGQTAQARNRLRQATHLADGAFLAGFLALNAGRLDEAARYLRQAVARHRTLGNYFGKYGLKVELALRITEEVVAHLVPCRRGARLGLVEIYQQQGKLGEALACLRELRREAPDDVVVNLSTAELLYEAAPGDRRQARQIVALAGNVKNDSSVHAALMLYKGRALRALGLPTAARDVLTEALRKKKDRSDEVRRALLYERACVYEDLGQKARARRGFETVYAQDPDYEDVAARLGLGAATP